MDLHTLYDWITSLLRPRGRCKSITDQPHQLQPEEFDANASAATAAAAAASNKFELIPTLNFVIQPPVEASFDFHQYVSAACAGNSAHDDSAHRYADSNHDDSVDVDVDDDNDSRHTYVIVRRTKATTETSHSPPTTPTTDTEAEAATRSERKPTANIDRALQRQEVIWSLSNVESDDDNNDNNDTQSLSSFVDEPTSSISIEMDNLSKTTITTTTTATGTGTTDGAALTLPTTTSRRNSNQSAMTTVTTPSSDQSIEEEIEEALEISEEQTEGDGNSPPLPEAVGYARPSLPQKKVSVATLGKPARDHLELFGIDDHSLSGDSGDVKAVATASSDDGLFRIDDEQLSGGKLAQHFMADDDDETSEDVNANKHRNNDDEADYDGDLSRHRDAVSDPHIGGGELAESLSNQSTTHDVSDFVEEPRGSGKPSVTDKEHDVMDVDATDEVVDASKHLNVAYSQEDDAASDPGIAGGEQAESLSNQSTAEDVSDFIEEPRGGTEPAESDNENLDLPPPIATSANQSFLSNADELLAIGLIGADSPKDNYENRKTANTASAVFSAASSTHSEKDHSVEELVAANHLIDMTLDDRDLSSLNPSFDIHNETLVNRLLADSMVETLDTACRTQTPEETAIDSMSGNDKYDHSNVVKSQSASSKIVTDLDESSAHDINKVQIDQKSEIMTTQPAMTGELIVENPTSKTEVIEAKMECAVELLSAASEQMKTQVAQPKAMEEEVTRIAPIAFWDGSQAEDDEDTSLELMKLRILAMKLQAKEQNTSPSGEVPAGSAEPAIVKQMERVPLTEFNKDVLEDITEESERNSLSTAEEQQSISLEKSGSTAKSENKTLHNDNAETSASMISLNMIKMLEQKVDDLQNVLSSKDACLASLNLQLENSQRRGSNGALSSEQPGSGRDTSSLLTSSTEYRTFQEDLGGGATMDFYMELCKRDEMIAKLTDSLQQSLNVRENLQAESEKLTTEVQLVRKQLTEAMEALRRPYWPRDQESNGGQRISEISMDLISESDDDLERHFFTDNEEKYSRNSRERQLSVPRQMEASTEGEAAGAEWSQTPFSKQIEQFQKYLTPSEVRLFFMVQKKFDDFLSQELEKCKIKYDTELKQTIEQLENQKAERDNEVKRLLSQRHETDSLHRKAMEDLRKYFETKCADLEKQYSDDVFSQKSQRHGADSSSDSSDHDQMPEELASPALLHGRSKETSPRKRTRAELLLSPSHRQMTPFGEYNKDGNGNISTEIGDIKSFYQSKIHDLQRAHDEHQRKLNEKLKYYETRYPDDEFMESTKRNENNNTTKITTNVSSSINATDDAIAEGASVAQHVADANTSLIIIDQDELNPSNESQVIHKIIEEYERRLQEQLTLAREDIVHELEHQIQTLLSETTVDDHHWPPELILLREKFTAKSQLEIAQLQLKHEDEMSRLKLEHEKQLNRKTKRNLSFDSARDFDRLVSERDSLRELSQTFRHVLAELAKCVASCENEINYTILEEVQRLLAHNRTIEDQQLHEDELPFNQSMSMFNMSLSASKQQPACVVPDVQALLEVVEDPSLMQYVGIHAPGYDSGSADEFDLQQCVERLRGEAAYLLQLSEGLGRRQKHTSSGSVDTRNECGVEVAETEAIIIDAIPNAGERHFLRTKSLNEDQLPTYQQRPLSSAVVQPVKLLCSLPPDLNRLFEPLGDELLSMSGGNASELNFQVHELRNRLLKSEADRVKLQHELEHTITRNAVLGQELQTLRDHLSAQLNSLSQTDVAEGYGLGSLKSPERLGAGCDESSSGFAQLQEKARYLLSTPTQQQQQQQQLEQQTSVASNNDATVVLLQMIEDFCREGDKVVESNKRDREDLQSQIDTADKQLKATRQFLEEQATEREQERDEFMREIERLKAHLRDKEKERSNYEHASKEAEQLETQVRELTKGLNETNAKRDKFEIELKASIDKIFVLREIISELETQVETKALNEHVLAEKNKQLEEYISSQSRSNETLQNEVQSLKIEIGEGYQERIRVLEEKLQNIRPSAEQSMVLDHVVEQLRDIENTLDHKTRTLESLHYTASSNSCSEDVSVHATRKLSSLPAGGTAIVSPPQGSPVHPSPRQHSFTMEGVQRVMEKLSKHTRVEEAAIKRVRDLEMQVTQMRNSCVELQHERDSLQERMSEQTQRISALQSRIEEQRQRAEELQRAGTADLSIRIHDLQTEVQNLRETLSVRDKQIATMKAQLEKSRLAIDRLEAELAVEQQPDRSVVSRLEADLKQKTYELQKVRERMKHEMINKLSLPDLMETMLADKNEEIDHLKEQLESKEKALQSAIELKNLSQNSSGGGVSVAGGFFAAGGGGGEDLAAAVAAAGTKDETSNKLSARTLSDIVSITEFDEPDVVRRAALHNLSTPLLVPESGGGGFLQQTMETSKEALANLTEKRTEELSVFAQLHQANTFEHPHYFQDPNMLMASLGKSGTSVTPMMVPRQINFSALTEEAKQKSWPLQHNESQSKEAVEKLQCDLAELRSKLDASVREKESGMAAKEQEIRTMEKDLAATQQRLGGLQQELTLRQQEIEMLRAENEANKRLQQDIGEKAAKIDQLLHVQEQLTHERQAQTEQLSKHEKNVLNYRENEEKYLRRIDELERELLQSTEQEMAQRENLRKELQSIGAAHEQCKYVQRDAELRKQEIERLNEEMKAKDDRLHLITTRLVQAEEQSEALQRQIGGLERDLERLRQQQTSEHSSKQFSVDEIAQQVEKELNYSAQLDSNILRAIESEEENNLDVKQLGKGKSGKEQQQQQQQVVAATAAAEPQGTDDENFTGERDLLNQLELLRAQIAVEREQSAETRQELLAEKQHSQEIQEQDVLIIEAMRKRLETALEKEDELHKQLDMERERCERLQTQLTALQRAESRRNSSLLLKSPTESPRKSPRSLAEFESELADRLRSELKLLAAQNERERERCADLQRSGERERQRHETELEERIAYCDRLKREMEKVARDKDTAAESNEHLQERLTLQTQEIESLEARLAALQEAETRRTSRRERQRKESAQMLAELQELKTKLLVNEGEREVLAKTIATLRYDIERSAQRETQLTEALANANSSLSNNSAEATVPQQFLQKMKEINTLLAENTHENRQMAETVQFLVEERRQLQKRCEDLDAQLSGTANVGELEERCNHLLGRYLRVESHRKALVYQKRYLKISLQSYQDSEQRALAAINGGHMLQASQQRTAKKKLFKTVALAIVAIQRMKYIGRIWHTGKRIALKSVFTITQQKRSQAPAICCAAVSSTSTTLPPSGSAMQMHQQHGNSPYKLNDRQFAPLQAPMLLNDYAAASSASALAPTTPTPLTPITPSFDWPRLRAQQQ